MDRLLFDVDRKGARIRKHIYGHFAEHLGRCIYEGMWVGPDSPIPNTDGLRNDVIQALRDIRIPVLRWPGGCYADIYHWRDGIGPHGQRPFMLNTHWGGVIENNHFGTHEFFRLCELIGADPYICGNLGSGTVQEMQAWVEYMTFDGESPMANLRRQNGRESPWTLPFFGVGNENWGCGGDMRAEYYADEYRRYATYVRNFGDNRIYRVAGGASVDDWHWTEVLMREAAGRMDGLSLHYYTRTAKDWAIKGSATDFSEAEWFSVLGNAFFMNELVDRHGAIMDRYDPEKRVGLIVDEWGTWFDVEPGTNPGFLYQQNTLRDAMVAAVQLNGFINRCERVHMANLAQTVNVLQSVVLTDGARMLRTPTWHVFDLFKAHQDATLLPVTLQCASTGCDGHEVPAVDASASVDADGRVHVSLCNLRTREPAMLRIEARGMASAVVSGRMLTAPALQAHNTFEAPDAVRSTDMASMRLVDGTLDLEVPAHAIVMLEFLP